MIILPMEIHSYRIQGSENETLAFIPYEKGFVGRREETPAIPVRTNQGYESVSIAMDIGRNRLQNCPGMVGPLDDGKFYCTSRLHGYCDARSGACFCNEGYAGDSCEDCDPTHHLIGDLCYEKMFCPNDCSNSGQCDYLTGTCACNEYREGQDCSEFTCSKHHAYCTQCDDSRCLQCIQGYSVNENEDLGSQCEPCSRFDPRCHLCDTTRCLECVDLLLHSIRRSGRRPQDPLLPHDELERQLSSSIPFGSQQNNVFDEAESYKLVDNPELIPLDKSALACDQGVDFDSSFKCRRVVISNKICGHEGVISFASPEYQVYEDEGHVRLTVERSGGGAGSVNVSYGIEHITTDEFYRDVSPTAMYATDQNLSFGNHEVQKSFLLPIHNDVLKVSALSVTL